MSPVEIAEQLSVPVRAVDAVIAVGRARLTAFLAP